MFRKGVTLLAAGDPGAALLEFQEALTNAVGDAKADSLYNIAVCYVRLGDMDMAMQALVKAVGLDPQLAQEIRLDQDFAPLAATASFHEMLAAADSVAGRIGASN